MRQARITGLITAEGEILQEHQLVAIPKRRRGPYKEFTFMPNGPQADYILNFLAEKPGAEAISVYIALLANLDYENWININQSALARRINIPQPNFVRAIKKLVAIGVLERGPKVDNKPTFKLNEAYGWRGQSQNYTKAIAERMKAKGLSVHQGGQAGR